MGFTYRKPILYEFRDYDNLLDKYNSLNERYMKMDIEIGRLKKEIEYKTQQNAKIQSLYEDINRLNDEKEEYKKLYTNECQKRLELIELVNKMEHRKGE